MKIDGGCHCGNLAYEAEANPDHVTVCHCTDCQSLSGSAFRTVLPVRREDFRMLRGEPKIYVKRGSSGNQRPQAFCAECGSPIYATGVGEAAGVLGIRLGTCNQRAELPPRREVWCRSALAWVGELGTTSKQPQS